MADPILAYLDQATFLAQRATGRAQLTQLVWVYERPLDYAGLESFHENFGYGLAGRRIERSAVPFGRHRWVSAVGPAADLDVAVHPRARGALSDWIDERAQLPVDPEHGPGWHLGVLPMTDGSTAVSLVGSHCLFDGLGLLQTVGHAVDGTVREIGYPAPGERPRARAVAADAARAAREAGPAVRALRAGLRMARQRHDGPRQDGPRPDVARPAAPAAPAGGGDDTIVLPAVSVFVDLPDWDRAAERRGGNGHSLLAGFAAELGARMRRRAADGTVALLIAISDRADGDTRANALRFARADITPGTADLTATRAALRTALGAVREAPDETFALLPLTPFIPKRAVRHMSRAVFGAKPVSCSNLGEVAAEVTRVDGTEAEYLLLRPADQNVSRREIESCGGHLVLAAGRVAGRMSIGIVGYQPAVATTKADLRALAAAALDGCGLTATMI
ncbi:hypothetical protein [Mycolicibacterium sp.]|uniref:hypothetical protein n=1 Tax=Mycolicibacterium sp. TaxID=2320850 RepID=UPI003D1152A7